MSLCYLTCNHKDSKILIAPFCCTTLVDIDYCTSYTCLNGGSCQEGNDTFVCLCALGWTGVTCESNAFAISWKIFICFHDVWKTWWTWWTMINKSYVYNEIEILLRGVRERDISCGTIVYVSACPHTKN